MLKCEDITLAIECTRLVSHYLHLCPQQDVAVSSGNGSVKC